MRLPSSFQFHACFHTLNDSRFAVVLNAQPLRIFLRLASPLWTQRSSCLVSPLMKRVTNIYVQVFIALSFAFFICCCYNNFNLFFMLLIKSFVFHYYDFSLWLLRCFKLNKFTLNNFVICFIKFTYFLFLVRFIYLHPKLSIFLHLFLSPARHSALLHVNLKALLCKCRYFSAIMSYFFESSTAHSNSCASSLDFSLLVVMLIKLYYLSFKWN